MNYPELRVEVTIEHPEDSDRVLMVHTSSGWTRPQVAVKGGESWQGAAKRALSGCGIEAESMSVELLGQGPTYAWARLRAQRWTGEPFSSTEWRRTDPPNRA